MQFSRRSITTKLLLLFLLVGLSSVLIVGTYSFYSAKRAIMIRTVDQLISVRAVKKQQVEYFFTEKFKNLKNLARNENLGRIFPVGFFEVTAKKSLEQEIDHLRNYYLTYGFSNLFLVSGDPRQPRVLTADSTHPYELSQKVLAHIKSIVAETSDGKDVAISDLFYRSDGDSIPVCLIGCSSRAAQIDSPVTVILEIPAGEINRIMLQNNSKIGLGHSGEAYLVGGDFLMRSASRFITGSLLRIPVKSETVKMALNGQTGASLTDDYRGIRVFSAYEPLAVAGLNWVVLAEIDYEEAMIPVTGLRNDILLVSVIISIFILGFAQLITKMVTQPIIRLKNAAARLGEGDFDNKVIIHSRDEIGSLAETFNTMSDQVREERRKRILALFDGQEMERRRISRELHDGLGQRLVGTKLHIENCDEDDPSCLLKTMQETKSSLHGIVDELRRISNDLMPAALDELGLETALQNLCSDVGRQLGIEVDFDSNLTSSPDDNTAIYIFRIAQEGIHNIIKHAKAASISMQLIGSRDSFIMILEDDGVGFNPVQTVKGNGLSNMKERAGLLGGTFSVESETGKGTTIRVKIPKKK
jgi:two-component system NarL family sensor kinase